MSSHETLASSLSRSQTIPQHPCDCLHSLSLFVDKLKQIMGVFQAERRSEQTQTTSNLLKLHLEHKTLVDQQEQTIKLLTKTVIDLITVKREVQKEFDRLMDVKEREVRHMKILLEGVLGTTGGLGLAVAKTSGSETLIEPKVVSKSKEEFCRLNPQKRSDNKSLKPTQRGFSSWQYSPNPKSSARPTNPQNPLLKYTT